MTDMSNTNEDKDDARAQALAQVASITAMVAALEVDYERLEELREARAQYQERDKTEPLTESWGQRNREDAVELAALEEAAGECESREEAEQRIHEDPLSVEVRSGRLAPYAADGNERPSEFRIVLCTGPWGPHVELIGELDDHNEPSHARVIFKDWGTRDELFGFDRETVLTYCRQFSFWRVSHARLVGAQHPIQPLGASQMPTTYPPLAIGAKRRLNQFRTEASAGKWVRPMTWRDVRFATLKSESGLSSGANGSAPVWYSQSGPAFRNERFADEVEYSGIDHKGWYTDGEFADETARGLVVRLPHGRFLAGYLMSMNDERVYFGEIFDNEKDAARMADEHARVIGEQESAYQTRRNERQQLESKIEDAESSIREHRASHSLSVAAQRCEEISAHSRSVAAMRASHAREAVSEIVETLRALRTELADYSDVE